MKSDSNSLKEERGILFNRLREHLGIQSPSVYTLLGYDGHREILAYIIFYCVS